MADGDALEELDQAGAGDPATRWIWLPSRAFSAAGHEARPASGQMIEQQGRRWRRSRPTPLGLSRL